MSALDPATRGLVTVAAAIDGASEGVIVTLMERAKEQGTRAEWLEELVLMAVLFAGFPKALVAAGALRAAQPLRDGAGDAADYDRWQDWRSRGEETCRAIYGGNYDSLRRNVQALNPVLDAWIVTDGYGRTISRPALDLKRRELCAIAMLVPQGVPRQLHSHLRGALNAGATEAEVEEALNIAAQSSSTRADLAEAGLRLWNQVRSLTPRP